jgi:hypothetical protein
MTSTADGFVTDLDDALQRRAYPMTTPEFVAVLQEVSGFTSESVTAGERSFLLADPEVTADDLTPAARVQAAAEVARGRMSADGETATASLSTAEVADLLGRAQANVRRSYLSGDLYSPIKDGGGRRRYPVWQFVGGRPVPGLRRVLAALPDGLHPLSVKAFMTAPVEPLEGMTPVDWLVEGGSVDAVVTLATQVGYE